MSKFFVSGPPGSGKTYLGEHLEAHYGWTHFDCEKYYLEATPEQFSDFLLNPLSMIPDGDRVVVTWGFVPSLIDTVRLIVSSGFTSVWLTGERAMLLKVVLQRAQQNQSLDYNYCSPQYWANEMFRIATTSKRLLKPHTTLQVFDRSGKRIDLAPLLINLTEGEQCPR